MNSAEKLHAEPRRFCHAKLRRITDTSPFKVWCPVCAVGILLVARHQETLQLINVDRCTHCAQLIVYTDQFIGGEAVLDVTVKH